jgi:hypothetical protein
LLLLLLLLLLLVVVVGRRCCEHTRARCLLLLLWLGELLMLLLWRLLGCCRCERVKHRRCLLLLMLRRRHGCCRCAGKLGCGVVCKRIVRPSRRRTATPAGRRHRGKRIDSAAAPLLASLGGGSGGWRRSERVDATK